MNRPFNELPVPFPKDYDPGCDYFYHNIVQPLTRDMIDMMDNGLYVDQEKVEELRKTVDEVLDKVSRILSKNHYIESYQEIRAKKLQFDHSKKAVENIRDTDFYLKEYDEKKIEHRTAVVNYYLKTKGWDDCIKDKWTVADLKKLNIFKNDSFLESVIEKTVKTSNATIKEGMKALAEHKAYLWNKVRYEKAKQTVTVPPFNPGSSKQKQELFEMLEVPAISYSDKTGKPSWDRDAIVELKKTTPEDDEAFHEMLDCFIDYSYSDIIKNNFIKAFDKFTIDGVMHGNVRLFGAKSFRPTSNSPNLLNAPSTKSIYAKPLKRCFTAPEGYVVYAIDLSALEDRVIANLSKDTSKINVFKEGLDGHSLNACGYFTEEIENILGKQKSSVDLVKAFMKAVDDDNSRITKLRQRSKAPTFKLAYGGYPDDHKGGVITQEIFDRYHNVLYPGITDYRENYVLKTAKEQGYLHLGLGCRIYTDDPEGDIRTLHNATVQFWSILTLIAVNELNHRILENDLEEVAICSTIYDSIYIYVLKDAETIQWLNNNAVEILTSQYLQEEEVSNEAEGEIGNNWADLKKLKNNASIDEINEILKEL